MNMQKQEMDKVLFKYIKDINPEALYVVFRMPDEFQIKA